MIKTVIIVYQLFKIFRIFYYFNNFKNANLERFGTLETLYEAIEHLKNAIYTFEQRPFFKKQQVMLNSRPPLGTVTQKAWSRDKNGQSTVEVV